jgi:hypothetical protein
MGLDVGKSQKWPCQHLGLFKFEFCTEKKLVQENTDDDILTKRYFPGAYHIQKREENGYTGLIVVKANSGQWAGEREIARRLGPGHSSK